MDKILRLIISLAVLCSANFLVRAQPRITQEKDHKVKVKGDRVVVRDKSKPVRQALEQQYAKIAEATRKKDLAGLLALRTPENFVGDISWYFVDRFDHVYIAKPPSTWITWPVM